MVTLTERLPSDDVRTVTRPSPSQRSWTHSRPGMRCPATASFPPGTALPEAVSVAEAAPAASNGASSAGASSRIGNVASQSRIRWCRLRVGKVTTAGRSSTQRDPSQNMRSRLRSATGWLGEPRGFAAPSRGGVLFRGDRPVMAVRHRCTCGATYARSTVKDTSSTVPAPCRMVRSQVGPSGPWARVRHGAHNGLRLIIRRFGHAPAHMPWRVRGRAVTVIDHRPARVQRGGVPMPPSILSSVSRTPISS
jgi:hypothetical protein